MILGLFDSRVVVTLLNYIYDYSTQSLILWEYDSLNLCESLL
jgi:hypothetical protein